MLNQPPPLKRDYNGHPYGKALKGGGLMIMGLHFPGTLKTPQNTQLPNIRPLGGIGGLGFIGCRVTATTAKYLAPPPPLTIIPISGRGTLRNPKAPSAQPL